jgi:hypothetical protein
VPCSLTVANSSRRVRRAALGSLSAAIKPPGLKQQPVKRRCGGRSESLRLWATDACVPAGDDGPEWRDRLWYSSARGSRAGVCACAWKVGKFFS